MPFFELSLSEICEFLYILSYLVVACKEVLRNVACVSISYLGVPGEKTLYMKCLSLVFLVKAFCH